MRRRAPRYADAVQFELDMSMPCQQAMATWLTEKQLRHSAWKNQGVRTGSDPKPP